VVAEFAAVLASYGLSEVTGDRYAGEWPSERFIEHGISYIAAEQPKSQIYCEFLPLLNGGQVELLDNARLIAQLCSLERRTARAARDSVDHPPGGHDDIINSVAGALVAVSGVNGAPRVGRGIWLWTKWQAEALAAKNAERKPPAVTYAVGSVEWERQQQDRLSAAHETS